MEMDYNLKEIANFFKFYLCIAEMSLKFSPWYSNSDFMIEKKRFFVKI